MDQIRRELHATPSPARRHTIMRRRPGLARCVAVQLFAVVALVALHVAGTLQTRWLELDGVAVQQAPGRAVRGAVKVLSSAPAVGRRPRVPASEHLQAFVRFLGATGQAQVAKEGIDLHLIREKVIAELHPLADTPIVTLHKLSDASLATLANNFGAVATIQQHTRSAAFDGKPGAYTAPRVAAPSIPRARGDSAATRDESGRVARIIESTNLEGGSTGEVGHSVSGGSPRAGRDFGVVGSAVAVARIRGIDVESALTAPLHEGDVVLTRHIGDSSMTLWLEAVVVNRLRGGEHSAEHEMFEVLVSYPLFPFFHASTLKSHFVLPTYSHTSFIDSLAATRPHVYEHDVVYTTSVHACVRHCVRDCS